MPKKQRSKEEIDGFLNLARDRFKLAAQAESATRRESLDDLEFSIGNQWPSDIKADRQLAGRPCLTVNVLPQFIRQVTNEQRQQRPSPTVNPVGNGADVDTAEILQGIIRHIEVHSDSEVSDDYAFDYMVRTGFGYEMLDTIETKEKGNQEIKVRLIRNSFCVYLDPNAQELDRSDAKWGFLVADIPVSEYREQNPDSLLAANLATLQDYCSVGDMTPGWASTSGPLPTIRVADYWFLGPDAETFSWAKISGLDIIDEEETIWAVQDASGAYLGLPLLGVYGDDLIVNSKQHLSGIVRFAKDPQRQKNYWASAATEMIALAPKAPFIGYLGQFKSKQVQWEQANYRNFSYLEVDPLSVAGELAPLPQRNSVEPPIQAMNAMLQMATLDLQATTGLYANNLGKQETPNESGKAVLARQKQGETNTLNYSDNMARMIRRRGRMIVNAIRKVYTAAKIQRIIKPDSSVSQVGLFNSEHQDAQEAHTAIAQLDPDIAKVFDIGTGDYDVTVSVGPSYQTRRQEAVATQMALVESDPQLMGIIGDLIVGNMDIPGAREIADRLKKILPPALQDSDDPEAAQQKLIAQHAQLVQQVQLLSQNLQQAQQIIATKQVEKQADIQKQTIVETSRQAIVKMQEATKLAVAQMNASKDINQSFAENEIEQYKILHTSAHEVAMAADDRAHEKEMAQAAAQQAAQQQQSDQGHDVNMAALNQDSGPEGAGAEQ